MRIAGLSRSPIVPAVLIPILVSTVTWVVAIQRPIEYAARVNLLAAPAPGADSTTLGQFPGVASQSLPAIIDVAHSRTVLAKASGGVDGSPAPEQLSNSVVIDVVPNSLLTRITVRGPSPEVARRIVLSIAAEVIAKDLLSPIGELRLVDDEPSVAKVAPDNLLAAGLALAAGAAAMVAVLTMYALIRPSRRQQVRRALATAGISHPVALVDRRQSGAIGEIEVLSAASARPVRVVALTPSTATDVAGVSTALASAGVLLADDRSDEAVSIVGVASDTAVEKLTGAIAALPEQAHLIAVLLTGSRSGRHQAHEIGS
jgi:capsular polysaccharide biosynthesis protein